MNLRVIAEGNVGVIGRGVMGVYVGGGYILESALSDGFQALFLNQSKQL